MTVYRVYLCNDIIIKGNKIKTMVLMTSDTQQKPNQLLHTDVIG